MLPYSADQDRTDLHQRIRMSIRRVGRRVYIDAHRFDSAITGHNLNPGDPPTFLTVRQVAERHPGFTEAALRQLIARAEKAAV